jgi:hypothetical protein
MKNMARVLILTVATMFLAVSMAFGAGSVTQTLDCTKDGHMCFFTFSWVGDAADGTVPAKAMDNKYLETLKGYHIYLIRTDPGTVAPTTLYDITLPDATGFDLAGGMLANRSATLVEQVVPKVDTVNYVYGAATIKTAPILTITNQAVVSATGDVLLVCVKE